MKALPWNAVRRVIVSLAIGLAIVAAAGVTAPVSTVTDTAGTRPVPMCPPPDLDPDCPYNR
jgi:hypothetical protein